MVAVQAFSPNRGESFVLERAERGFRPGKDIAGVIVKPARSGHGPGVGDRVVAHLDHSGWAERAVVPIDRLAVVPEAISSEEAAALPLAGVTALRLTRATGPVASRRLLLTGASGGVGHYFVELAASQGTQITVVAATDQRARRLLELGASERIKRNDPQSSFTPTMTRQSRTTWPRSCGSLPPDACTPRSAWSQAGRTRRGSSKRWSPGRCAATRS